MGFNFGYLLSHLFECMHNKNRKHHPTPGYGYFSFGLEIQDFQLFLECF